jgi:hypothetical protein
MEAALRTAINGMFEDYVSGLDKVNLNNFPVIMKNLVLKPKRVNEDMEDTPFNVEEGSIGMIKVSPGWMGNVDIEASGIKVKLSFSAMKAAKLAMKPQEYDYGGQDLFLTGGAGGYQAPAAPPPPCPPQWCSKHDTSEKREKREPHETKCKSCGITYTTSYCDTVLCPPCSDKEKRCLICGEQVEKVSMYIPAMSASQAAAQQQKSEALKPSASMSMKPSGSMQVKPSGSMQLRPSDSMPVLNPNDKNPHDRNPNYKNGNAKQDAASVLLPPAPPPAPTKSPQQQANNSARAPVPGPTPVPMGRAPPRGAPPRGVPQPEDDETFLDFLRNFTCSAVDFDDQEYEASRGPPGPRTRPMPTR